ncbi:MAG TPA: ATP-binding protein [Streptosporangiaceae bacterium]|nr:ATP-binding protein [Streptosporangiaceae bacterium]
MSGPQPWQAFMTLPVWRITEIPRPREAGHDGSARDTGTTQRVQALVSASGSSGPVVVGWLRERPGGPVTVLAGGAGLASGHDDGQAVLTLPPGARGTPLEPGQGAGLLASLPCWTRICGISDVLRAERGQPGPGDMDAEPSLEDGLLSAWLDAFAWLLLAEPVPEAEINDLAAHAAHEQLMAENYRSPRSKLAARRAGAWHEELREGITAGMWRVHLLAGAATQEDAGRVARLVCASANLRGLPYGLTTRRGTGPLQDLLANTGNGHLPARVLPQQQPAAARANDRSWWDTPMYLQAQAAQARAAAPRQWPQGEHPAAPPGPAEAARQADDDRDTPVPASPFTASTRLVAALARTPAREVPGLRLVLRPEFDITPETSRIPSGNGASRAVTAGTVLDWNRVPAGSLTLPLASLNRHVFVCGATGSGKSQTIRGLLESATGSGIPWLVVEPAKAEYHLMAARLPDTEMIRIRPGELDVPPSGLNPLEPAPGPEGSRFPLQVHADLVRALFLAAFQADEPFPQVLAAALTRCYEQAGWDLVTGQAAAAGTQPGYPTLKDLQACALQVVQDIGYGREVADNVRGFVTVRIASLRLGTSGRFLDGGHRLDFAALLDRNVVFEIEDAGDDHDKAFLMGTVLIRLTEQLRLRHRHEPPGPVRLRHLTVIEEAHRLLRQPPPGTGNGPAAQAVEMFADLLAEVRAYGEGLIIAEQIPAKLIPDVIKNTAVKIVHRLPAQDDRDAVGATMNLTPAQSSYLVTLTPGEAAVHADGMDYPLLVRMPDGTSAERARPAVTATPAAVITARSASCDPQCIQRPCTLAQIRDAQNTAGNDPAITLWAELAVLAALTGWTPPVPTADFTARLLDLPERLLGCTLSHAADAAVAARASALGRHADPAALTIHVTTQLRDFAAEGRPFPPPAREWLAGACRWNVISTALAAHARDTGDHAPPHPDTSIWAEDYGRTIPGSSSGEQLATIRAWKNSAWAELTPEQRHALVFGHYIPSAIEKAVGGRAGKAQWRQRLTATMERSFTDGQWAVPWLTGAR